MKQKYVQHPISSIASLLLFLLFILFLLPVLIMSAGTYKASVQEQAMNNNLYTAQNYITVKFRQHDSEPGRVRLEPFEGDLSLCFFDTLEDQLYKTRLYLHEGALKELFSLDGVEPSPQMGTTIADLSSWTASAENGLYWFTLTDLEGNRSRFCLHEGTPLDMEGEGES